MRYLLQDCFSNELLARKAYISDTLSLWTIPFPSLDGFTTLKSLPENALDILFIMGHDQSISLYLTNHEIPERQIVAITCRKSLGVSELKLPEKALYLPKQDAFKLARLFQGNQFGFSFDLTESEILFYNSRKNQNINERLESAFYRIM